MLSTTHVCLSHLIAFSQEDLGDRLVHAFHGQSAVPYSDVNLKTHQSHGPHWDIHSGVAEISSIQLEFKELTRLTGKTIYAEKAVKVMQHLKSLHREDGLIPMWIHPLSGMQNQMVVLIFNFAIRTISPWQDITGLTCRQVRLLHLL